MSFKLWLINTIQGYLNQRNFVIQRLPLPDLNPLDIVAILSARISIPADEFCVLQVGANDGQYVDPIYHLLREHPWRAVLVEPLPEPFAKLRQLHRDRPNIIPVNCAVAEIDGQATMYRFENLPGIPSDITGLASFDRDMLERQFKHKPFLRKHIIETQVPAWTIRTLMQQYNLPRLNLLQVDAEGRDYRIIHSALEAGITPSIIQFESWHLSPQEKRSCAEELRDRGYQYVTIGPDTIAAHTSDL